MDSKFLLMVATVSVLFALAAAPVHAQLASAPTTCNDGTTSTATGRGACASHGGVQMAAAPAPAPEGAIAKCKDGTYSMAKNHHGACSKHGGVEAWLDQK